MTRVHMSTYRASSSAARAASSQAQPAGASRGACLGRYLGHPGRIGGFRTVKEAGVRVRRERRHGRELASGLRATTHAVGIVSDSSPRAAATTFSARSSSSNVARTEPAAATAFHACMKPSRMK